MWKKQLLAALASGCLVFGLTTMPGSDACAADTNLNGKSLSSRAHVVQVADPIDPRMRWYNNRWWYYHPDNRWSVYENGAWIRADANGRLLDSNGRSILDLPSINGRVNTYYRGPSYNNGNNYYRNRSYGRPNNINRGLNIRLF